MNYIETVLLCLVGILFIVSAFQRVKKIDYKNDDYSSIRFQEKILSKLIYFGIVVFLIGIFLPIIEPLLETATISYVNDRYLPTPSNMTEINVKNLTGSFFIESNHS